MFCTNILLVINGWLLLVNMILAADSDSDEPEFGGHVGFDRNEEAEAVVNSRPLSGSININSGTVTFGPGGIVTGPQRSRRGNAPNVVENSEPLSGSVNINRGTLIYGPDGIPIAPQRRHRRNAQTRTQAVVNAGPLSGSININSGTVTFGRGGTDVTPQGRQRGNAQNAPVNIPMLETRIADFQEYGRQAGEEDLRLGAEGQEIDRQAHEKAGQIVERSGGELYIIQVTASGLTSSRLTILQGNEVTADNDNMISNLPPGAIVCGKIKNSLIWTLDGVPYAGENIIENYESSGDAITFDLREVVREAQSLITITLWGNTISHNYT